MPFPASRDACVPQSGPLHVLTQAGSVVSFCPPNHICPSAVLFCLPLPCKDARGYTGHSVMQSLLPMLISNPHSICSPASPWPCKLTFSQVLGIGMWTVRGRGGLSFCLLHCHYLSCYGLRIAAASPAIMSAFEGGREGPCLLIRRAEGFPEASLKILFTGGQGEGGCEDPSKRVPLQCLLWPPFQVPECMTVGRRGPGPRSQEVVASRARLQSCPWSVADMAVLQVNLRLCSWDSGAGSGLQNGLSWLLAPS